MKKPLSLIIGLRYTRAKRRNHFISFISLASLLGIALGVMVLITVLSVMNGFNQQIRDKFFAITPAVTVITNDNIATQWPKLIQLVKTLPEVSQAAPYVTGNGMIMQGTKFSGVTLMGINPALEMPVSHLEKHIIAGNLNSLQPGKYNALIGKSLAESMNLQIGDQITVLTPQSTITLVGVFPRYKTFTITGIYHTTGGLYDTGLLYINIQDAETLYLQGQRQSGVHLRLTNLFQAPHVTHQLQALLPPGFEISNWTIQ